MGMGGNNRNSPHGNPMGMGISQKYWEWGWEGICELNRWEWEGMGMLKAIPAHLYFGGRTNVERSVDIWVFIAPRMLFLGKLGVSHPRK